MRSFVDSNVLVYAHDDAEPAKQARARAVLAELWEQRSGVLSVQVLQEFYVTVTRKWKDRSEVIDVRGIVESLAEWSPYSPSASDVVEAIDVSRRADLSFWDALIIVAAKRTGSDVVLTEDLNHGQVVEGVRIENPFLL